MNLRDERARLEAALAAGEDVRIALGCVLQLTGEWALAIAQLEPGIAGARAASNARAEVEGLISLGIAQQQLGHPDAKATHQASVERATSALGEFDRLGARARWELGKLVADAPLIERAAEIWVACAQPAWGLRALAYLAAMRGEPARVQYVKAIAALDHALGESNPLLVDVLLEAASFEPPEAAALRERATRIAFGLAAPSIAGRGPSGAASVPTEPFGVSTLTGGSPASTSAAPATAREDGAATQMDVSPTPPAPPPPPRTPRILDLRNQLDASLLRDLPPSVPELEVIAAYREGDDLSHASNAHAVFAVLAERPRPELRSLGIIQRASTLDGLPTYDACTHGDPAVWSSVPNLVRLVLGGIDLVHAIDHPMLLELVLEQRPICESGTWNLPKLRSLEWSVHGEADCEFSVVDPIWTQPFPDLRQVTLRGNFYECDGSLARPEIRERIRMLEQLWIPWSALEDDPIELLLANADHLRHLARLVVTRAELGDPRIPRLHRELPNLGLLEGDA